MKTEFIPVDYDYFDQEGRNYVKIYGRDENGNKICVIDTCPIYLWAILKEDLTNKQIQKVILHIKSIKLDEKGRQTKVEKVELMDKLFLGKNVRALKIHATNYKDLPEIANNLGLPEIEKRRGYDLGFITHYINESKLYPSVWYEIKYSSSGEFNLNINCKKVVKLVSKKKLNKTEWKPKTLAFDIETDSLNPNNGPMLMFSLAGSCGYKKVVSWKKAPTTKKYVELVKDEKELLKRFVELVKEYSPDFIVGYNSDYFDMSYIKERAKINRVRLPLGLDGSNLSTSRGQTPITKISGITHIDLIKFIRNMYSQYIKSETLKLNDIAKEFLGDKKLDFEFKPSGKITDEEWDKYYEYNLQDSVLTLNLFNKFLIDLIEFSRIIKEPTFKISRNGLAKQIEQYIIHNLEEFNEIPERRPGYNETNIRKGLAGVEGAFVYEPKPGLYDNLAMFDFTSMHTSIIITHNISGATLTENKDNSFISPEIETRGELKKYYFKKELGVFPTLMKTIFEKRRQFKKEYQENPNEITKARSNAFKVLSASAHGYIGFFGSRYYSWEASSSILAFVRKYNMEIIEKIKSAGHNIVYGDSISPDTKIWIKEKNKIKEIKIKELFVNIDTRTKKGKEYNIKKNIQTLTIDQNGKSVWKSVPYVMRHKTSKKMYRVYFTNNWYIDVTEDHSLIGYQSKKFNQSKKIKQMNRLIEIKPTEIKKKSNSIISIKKIPLKKIKTNNYPKEIYEFLGFFIGNGSFSQNKMQKKSNKDYYLSLSLGLDKKEIIKKLIIPLKEMRYIKNYLENKTKNGDIKINGQKLIKIVKEHCKNKNNKKSFPEFMFKEKEKNIASFIRGYFTADGTVIIKNKTPIIRLAEINTNFINKTRILLHRIGVSNSIFKENATNKYKIKNKTYSTVSISKYLLIKDKKTFMKLVGFLLNRKIKRGNIQSRASQKKLIKDFEFDLQQVRKVELIKTPKYVYDIEVEDTHRFFANNCLVHNTDSVVFTREEKSKEDVNKLLEKLNSELPGVMHLELEGFFKRGLWVSTRGGETGAKKKYALVNENGETKIRGFETVRRDWCPIARNTQKKVLNMVLKDGNGDAALKYIKEIIIKIKDRTIDKKDLIIKSKIKRPLNEYKAIGPHVIAARKMKERGEEVGEGTLVEYFIGKGTGVLIRDKTFLMDENVEYDDKYYLEKQLVPAVESILNVFNIEIKDEIEGRKQEKLGKWF